jgi:hypothetical protein
MIRLIRIPAPTRKACLPVLSATFASVGSGNLSDALANGLDCFAGDF